MLSNDILTDIYLYYNNDKIFDSISGKENVMNMINQLPDTSRNIYSLYQKKLKYKYFSDVITLSVRENNKDIICKIISNNYIKQINEIEYKAGRYGNKDMVMDMINRSNSDLSRIMKGAIAGGHIDIVNDMIDKGFDNFNEIAYSAAESGSIDIVNHMINRGANNFNRIAHGAALGRHKDIVYDMIKRDPEILEELLEDAGWRKYCP